MKKILTGALMAVLIMACSVHFSMLYLNYMRAIGIGFTPADVSVFKHNNLSATGKGLLRAGD